MTAGSARDYHERTKHTPASVRSGGRGLDWANQPLPFKRYPGLEPIALPRTWPEPDVAASAVLSGLVGQDGRASAQPGDRVDVASLARLLFLSAGVTRRRGRGRDALHFRAAPSAGALYPVEVYLACADLAGLPAGVYHFEPVEFALRAVRHGDHRGALALAADHSIARRPVTLVLSGIPWRTTWKYGLRGWRHLFWDAGAVLANLLAAVASAGLDARVLAGFVDADVSRLLGMGQEAAPFAEYPLAVVPVGPPGPEAPPPGQVETLDLEVEPLSAKVGSEPGLQRAHAAGDLGDPDAVAAWRAALAQRPAQPAATEVRAPAGADGTFDEVVLRRGSTRRFDPQRAAPRAALTWGMAAACRPLAADFTSGDTLLTHLLAVHAVEGFDPGIYRWAPDGPQLLRPGDLRRQAAHCCLDQALGGTSAFTAFHAAELHLLLQAGGDRAYRVAQLEAGVAAGRLQLAAFTLGLGGTGLTFYDDEVRRLFQTEAEPMLATAVGAPAYEAHPGRRPSELPPIRFS